MCFRKPSVIAYAAVVGKAENEGPYGGEFDEVVEDNKAGSDTWEQGNPCSSSARSGTSCANPGWSLTG